MMQVVALLSSIYTLKTLEPMQPASPYPHPAFRCAIAIPRAILRYVSKPPSVPSPPPPWRVSSIRCRCAGTCITKSSEKDLPTPSVPIIDLHYSGINCVSLLPPRLS